MTSWFMLRSELSSRIGAAGATGEVMAVGRAVQFAIARLVSGVISESCATVPVGE